MRPVLLGQGPAQGARRPMDDDRHRRLGRAHGGGGLVGREAGEVAQRQRLLVAGAQAVHRGQHLGDGVAVADLVGGVPGRRRREPATAASVARSDARAARAAGSGRRARSTTIRNSHGPKPPGRQLNAPRLRSARSKAAEVMSSATSTAPVRR